MNVLPPKVTNKFICKKFQKCWLSQYFVQNKGSIVNRTYDFSVCGFIMSFERSKFLDFSSPLFENRIGNYVNMNKLQHSFDWAFFIRPFNNTSWIFSLGKRVNYCSIAMPLHLLSPRFIFPCHLLSLKSMPF